MDEALKATTLTVTGMTCSGCASKVDTALRGLEDVSLHYPDTTVGVLHGAAVTPEILRDAVTSLGFEVAAA